MKRLRGLDGLRGIAVMLVLAFHYTWGFEHIAHPHSPGLVSTFYSGQYGVELFFMISGYVILMTVERTGDLKTFAAARFSRLYPAFAAAVLFTTAVTHAFGFFPPGLSQPDVIGNFVMVTFLLGIPVVDTSYWTLSYEVVFYVIISVGLLGLRVRRPEAVCLAWLAVACFCRFVLHYQLPSANHPGSRLAVLTASDYAQFFVVGMMIHRIHSGHRGPLTLATLGLAVVPIAITVSQMSSASLSAGLRYGCLMLVFALLLYVAPLRRIPVLQKGPLPWLGDISYSLYLIHQFAGYCVIDALERLGVNPNLAVVAAAALAIGAAAVMCRTIERPGQRLLARFFHGPPGRPVGVPR